MCTFRWPCVCVCVCVCVHVCGCVWLCVWLCVALCVVAVRALLQDPRTQEAIHYMFDDTLRLTLLWRLVMWGLFFLILVAVGVTHTGRDATYTFGFSQAMSASLVYEEINSDYPDTFADIANVNDFYDWLKNPVTDAIYDDTLGCVCLRLAPLQGCAHSVGGVHSIRPGGVFDQGYANNTASQLKSFNYLMGRPRLRQLRSEPVACDIPCTLAHAVLVCVVCVVCVGCRDAVVACSIRDGAGLRIR